MFDRQNNKPTLNETLLGMDFSKLEKTALQVGTGIHDSIVVMSPTSRNEDIVQRAAMDAMLESMQKSMISHKSMSWDELTWISPGPHCQEIIYDLIDSFWANPGTGHMYLYLEQLRKNPITRDLFKSKSTTHHFPWYKRGSKY